MMKYDEPMLEITKFEEEDVIRTSGRMQEGGAFDATGSIQGDASWGDLMG